MISIQCIIIFEYLNRFHYLARRGKKKDSTTILDVTRLSCALKNWILLKIARIAVKSSVKRVLKRATLTLDI